jgi:hypothetical protein
MTLISYYSSGVPMIKDFGTELAYKNGFQWNRTINILDPGQDFTGGVGQMLLYEAPGKPQLAFQPSINTIIAQAGSMSIGVTIAVHTFDFPQVWFELAARNAAAVFVPYIVGWLKVVL